MRDLLKSEFYRFIRNPVHWLLLAASVLSGVIYGVSSYYAFDDFFIAPLFVIQAIFVSLSIGIDYADGTIRNKVIAGKTKTVLFFSKLVTSIAISIMMTVAFLIPCIVILFVDTLSHIPVQVLMWTLFGFFLLNIAWAVLFTLVSALISTKGVGGVINLVLIIAVMLASYQLESLTDQPEFMEIETCTEVAMNSEEIKQVINGTYQGDYSSRIDENGVITYSKYIVTEEDIRPNPRYIKEPMNSFLRGVDAVLPSGQVNEYASCLTSYRYGATEDDSRIETFPIYSLSIIVGLTLIGALIFRKKEFK